MNTYLNISDKNRKRLNILFSILPFLAIFTVKPAIDNDTYWIIKTGEYIWNNGIPVKDFLTMHTDMDLVVQQWLSDIIYYKAYDLLGAAGLSIILIATFTLYVFLLKRLCAILSDKKIVNSVFVLITSIFVSTFFVTRPQIFTYCIVLIEMICLEKYIRDNKIKHLFVLPILSILLVNMHASMWTMQFIILLPYIINALPIKTKHNLFKCCKLLPLLLTAGVCAICGLLTPYGYKGLAFIFTTSIGDKVDSSKILELQPTSLSFDPFYLFIYVALLFTIVCFALLLNRKPRIRFILLSLGTAAMLLMYIKLIPYFFTVSLPCVLAYMDNINYNKLFNRLKEKSTPDTGSNKTRKILVSLILVIGVSMFCLSASYFISEEYTFITNGVTGTMETTNEAIEYMQNDIDEKNISNVTLYNGFDVGGYLEFKGYTTYIDPRADSFIDEANHDFDYLTEYFDLARGRIYYKDVFDKYNFNYAIITLKNEKTVYVNLSNDDDYEIIFENDDYAVFGLKTRA